VQITFKKKIFELIDPSSADDTESRIFNIGMIILVSLNIVAVMLETEAEIYSHYRTFFNAFDVISVGIFTIEYILRIWSCTENLNYKDPVGGRLRFALSTYMLIDLISFLPFYIPMWGLDLRFIRAVRLFRLFRVMKMGRYSQSLTKILKVVKSKKEDLGITLFAGIILLIVMSSLLYFIEHDSQPEKFSSIPASMWWGVVTLTTVGYGDVFPITVLGKIVGGFISVLGIGLFALPAGIIASGFASELQDSKSTDIQVCPHCGKEISQKQLS
jgi:voltage-gated potassium channel